MVLICEGFLNIKSLSCVCFNSLISHSCAVLCLQSDSNTRDNCGYNMSDVNHFIVFALQVKHPVQLDCSEEKLFQWEILFQRQEVCEPKLAKFSLPVWAGTWKIMNFAFRQQKPKWDCIWPDYEQSLSNKWDKVKELEEQVGTNVGVFPPYSFNFIDHIKMNLIKNACHIIKQDEPWDWEDSWKLSGPELGPDDIIDDDTLSVNSSVTESTEMMRINEVFLPGWSDSWLLAAPPLEEEEEHHKNWSSSWGYRQQKRWVGTEIPVTPVTLQLHLFMVIWRQSILVELAFFFFLDLFLNTGNLPFS